MQTQPYIIRYPSYQLHFTQNEINFSLNTGPSYQEQHNICHSYISTSSYKTIINTGRWNQDEHKRFIEALFIYGNEWKKVQKYIQSRTATQSRSHAQKFFLYFRKKFVDVYSEKDLFEKENNELYEKVLNIMMDMPQCEHIAKYCGSVVGGKKREDGKEWDVDNIKKVIMRNFAFSSSNMDVEGYLEERKKKFLKVVLSMIQINVKGGRKEEQDENKNCLNGQYGNCYNVSNVICNPFKLQFDVEEKQNEEDENCFRNNNNNSYNQICSSSFDTSNFFDNY